MTTQAELATHMYQGLARNAGVQLCWRCKAFPFRQHYNGVAGIEIVHFSYRQRVLKAGIRNFLVLAAEAKDPAIKDMPDWMRLWTVNVEATRLAQMMGLRLPHKLSDMDRARVRAYLDEVSETERSYYGDVYVKAQRWAAR